LLSIFNAFRCLYFAFFQEREKLSQVNATRKKSPYQFGVPVLLVCKGLFAAPSTYFRRIFLVVRPHFLFLFLECYRASNW
jgi:hypothetical protein